MDKNTLIGITLCIAVFIGFSLYNRPSEEQLAAAQKYRDSLNLAYAQRLESEAAQERLRDSIAKNEAVLGADSASRENYARQFGKFSGCAFGTEQTAVLKNNRIKVTLSSKGAQIVSAEVLDYQTYSGGPLLVMKEDAMNEMNIDFFSGSQAVSTKKLFFETVDVIETAKENSPAKAVFRAKAGADSYIEYAYELKDDGYLLDYTVTFHNMKDVINKNSSYVDFTWNQALPVLERGNKWESQHSGLYYKFEDESSEYLSLTADDDKANLNGFTKWIAYKGEFFSSVLIAKTNFPNSEVSFKNINTNDNQKFMTSRIGFPVADTIRAMSFYFGPNKFKILKETQFEGSEEELGLQELVPLGWGIFGWINRIAIIPLFNWLGSFISNYGIIILIMTVIIKLVIFPLTYKSYKSTASMRVLKPQIDEISKKYPKQEQAMEKQQAVMALYRKVGINPMGGCLPLLLQMPILIAMFNFFPASIELRQQGFLWATDLSSYDSILDLPFSIPWYGDHVSLFTLLMAAAMVVSTKINSSQMDTGQQMPGMKLMMYFMPVMMVFWFNDYSSGLSYYYFLSNIITIIQMYVIRRTIDEKAILEKLNSKAAKNSGKKKSGFMARLEEAQRKQLAEMKKQQQNKKK